MTFTDWEVDAIRRGLNCYRIAKARQGRLLPWKAVINAVLLSEVTAHAYPIDGDEPEFKEEALRRFANGSQILQPDKLADLKAFLMDKEFLKEEEFGNASGMLAEAKATQSLIGSRSDNPMFRLTRMKSAYKATRQLNNQFYEEIELRILPQQNRDFFLAEETYSIMHRSPRPGPTLGRISVYRTELRRGFGFLFTGADLIQVALRGYLESDRIHLVEIMPFRERAYPDHVMLRLGADPPSPAEGNDFEAFLNNVNALKFEAIKSDND